MYWSCAAEFIICYISCCSKKYALHQSQHSNQWSKNITFIVEKIESCWKGWRNAWLKLDARNHCTCHERFLADTQPLAIPFQWLIGSGSLRIHIAKWRLITKVMLLISHNSTELRYLQRALLHVAESCVTMILTSDKFHLLKREVEGTLPSWRVGTPHTMEEKF